MVSVLRHAHELAHHALSGCTLGLDAFVVAAAVFLGFNNPVGAVLVEDNKVWNV